MLPPVLGSLDKINLQSIKDLDKKWQQNTLDNMRAVTQKYKGKVM